MLKHAFFVVTILLSTLRLESNTRPSSAPYLAGDTFRAYCDFIFDETGQNFKPESVKNGNTIFLKTDYLSHFFHEIHPRITARYILVTHNSDYPIPGDFAHILDDRKLIAWFGQNVENCRHPKLHPIPVGIANQYWPHGNIHVLKFYIEKIQSPRNILLYVNINVSTNPSVRKPILEMFENKPYSFVSPPTSFSNYLYQLGQSKFVLSPRGNGLDCHRTWEALYMGAIPIVESSTLDPLFEGLPVLIINDWSEISEEFLLKKFEEMSRKNYTRERIFADYWFKYINSFKKAS